MTQVPAIYRDTLDAFVAALANSPTALMKFKKTKYFISTSEVALGTNFVAYCADWQRGWAKFVDGELVDKKVGRVADKFVVVERDELDDRDPINWSKDEDGVPIDPWTRQDYLPLENCETGERCLFVTSSFGGRIGIEILCQQYTRRMAKGVFGLPTVRLSTGAFHTKRYGEITRPISQCCPGRTTLPSRSFRQKATPEASRNMIRRTPDSIRC
jgi:hypothetical protein